jgi:integrase
LEDPHVDRHRAPTTGCACWEEIDEKRLSDPKLEAGGRAPLTVNLTIKRVLKRAFKVAMDEGLISRNPCATVRPIRDTGKVEKGAFSPQQISQLVEHAEGDWKGLILAGYFTGGRLSDLARLKWSNVDLTEKSITFIQRKVEGNDSIRAVQPPGVPELCESAVQSRLT